MTARENARRIIRFEGPDQGMPFPEAHLAGLRRAVEEHGRCPLRPPG